MRNKAIHGEESNGDGRAGAENARQGNFLVWSRRGWDRTGGEMRGKAIRGWDRLGLGRICPVGRGRDWSGMERFGIDRRGLEWFGVGR